MEGGLLNWHNLIGDRIHEKRVGRMNHKNVTSSRSRHIWEKDLSCNNSMSPTACWREKGQKSFCENLKRLTLDKPTWLKTMPNILILATFLLSSVSKSAPLGSSYPHMTPVGKKIMSASEYWLNEQIKFPKFPQPAMCASNVSVILKLSGLEHYQSPLVPQIVNQIRNSGGIIIPLPKSPIGLAKTLDLVFHGRIPTGSLVSGCLRIDCSGEKGDGHIGIVGFTDAEQRIHLYHNNWFRPDNFNPPQRRPWMVSEYYYNQGLIRQWMTTPWLRLGKNQTGEVSSQEVILPEIDDLDPTNYYVTLSIPREVVEGSQLAFEQLPDGTTLKLPPLDFEKLCRHIRVKSAGGANLRSAPDGEIVSGSAQFDLLERVEDNTDGSLADELFENGGQWHLIIHGDEKLWIHASLTEKVCR